MHNYLQQKNADYDYTLSIDSQVSMPIISRKSQLSHEFDDGSMVVVGLSSQSFFEVDLQWEWISEENMAIIMDLWNDVNKADGMRRTFYWANSIKEYDQVNMDYTIHTYTARFLNNLTSLYKPWNLRGIQSIKLRIEGTKI